MKTEIRQVTTKVVTLFRFHFWLHYQLVEEMHMLICLERILITQERCRQ
nr:MAG TPA_asm: hypothetical protein [Bacteriophage sp.]